MLNFFKSIAAALLSKVMNSVLLANSGGLVAIEIKVLDDEPTKFTLTALDTSNVSISQSLNPAFPSTGYLPLNFRFWEAVGKSVDSGRLGG